MISFGNPSKSRLSSIMMNLIWKRVMSYIHEKVLTKLFPPCWVTQEQMVRITGEALLEMLYVAKVLGNKGSHRGIDVEIWYISEWIQKKGLITK